MLNETNLGSDYHVAARAPMVIGNWLAVRVTQSEGDKAVNAVAFVRRHSSGSRAIVVPVPVFTDTAELDAAVQAGLVAPFEGCDGQHLMAVREHPAYALATFDERPVDSDPALVYRRFLAGEPVDWVVVNKVTGAVCRADTLPAAAQAALG